MQQTVRNPVGCRPRKLDRGGEGRGGFGPDGRPDGTRGHKLTSKRKKRDLGGGKKGGKDYCLATAGVIPAEGNETRGGGGR